MWYLIQGWGAQDYTHSEQQWVLADPLNGRYEVTLQRHLCVFSASQQHAVLEERRGAENRFNKATANTSWL